MNLRPLPRHSVSIATLLLSGVCTVACSSDGLPGTPSVPVGGATGSAGNSATGAGSSNGGSNAAGSSATNAGAGGAGGSGSAGAAGSNPSAGAGGASSGSAGAAGASVGDPPPPHALVVDPACKCALSFTPKQADPATGASTSDTHAGDTQSLYINPSKKAQGKLVIVLGGIGGGPGGGGIEGFAKANGFHVFSVATQTATSSAPQKYKDMLKSSPMDPEANRQVGDARMEAFDGKDRVDWLDIKPADSIVNRTVSALKYGMLTAPGGGWDYYLSADGRSVRWNDVFMVGYSFGSQTIAMDSKYVRFGRVFTTSGPQDEGFPNATWISQPSATAPENLFMAVGFKSAYPSADPADKEVTGMFETVTKAGWIAAPIVNVIPGSSGPFMNAHLLAMVGSNADSPGGHTVFCNDNAKSGWLAACTYAFNVK